MSVFATFDAKKVVNEMKLVSSRRMSVVHPKINYFSKNREVDLTKE